MSDNTDHLHNSNNQVYGRDLSVLFESSKLRYVFLNNWDDTHLHSAMVVFKLDIETYVTLSELEIGWHTYIALQTCKSYIFLCAQPAGCLAVYCFFMNKAIDKQDGENEAILLVEAHCFHELNNDDPQAILKLESRSLKVYKNNPFRPIRSLDFLYAFFV